MKSSYLSGESEEPELESVPESEPEPEPVSKPEPQPEPDAPAVPEVTVTDIPAQPETVGTDVISEPEPEYPNVDLGRALDLGSVPEPTEDVPIVQEEALDVVDPVVESPVVEDVPPAPVSQSEEDVNLRRPGKRSETQLIGFLVGAAVVLVIVVFGLSRMLGGDAAKPQSVDEAVKVAMPIPDVYIDG